jgi:FlaA1/EpsC-like NDP-sugar epimerase
MIRRAKDAIARRRQANGKAPVSTSPLVTEARREGASGRVSRIFLAALREMLAARVWLLALGHVACFALVYWLAFAVRFDFLLKSSEWEIFLQSLPWVLSGKAGVFFLLGHYRGWWRYVTFADLVALIRTSVLSLLFVAACAYFIIGLRIPREVLILDCIFTIVLMGGLRSSFRIFREHLLPVVKPRDCRVALLVGTDDASGVLAHQIQSYSDLPYRIRGLLDTNGNTGKRQLGQIPVLGHMENVSEIAARVRATDVLLMAGIVPGKQLRVLMESCLAAQLNLKIIPGLEDRLSGNGHIPVRDIEINDLLRRDPVVLDHESVGKLIEGRVVLVTGAGGSIGSEICRQVLKFRPKRLVLVGRGENRIFHIERELRASERTHRASGCANRASPLSADGRGAGGEGTTEIHSRIGDVTDAPRMRQILEEFGPAVIFHAAAHKHVPLMEDNPGEAVKNNVLGTKTVADLAHDLGVECFVLISTDKAVRPTSVMGATKHLAERYVLALTDESKTRFVVTRFGNVLGSAGSVVPIFQDQIRRGGPITVTDPRMTRFFMTIPEASQLVLQAAAMGRGGEIFVLDMGEPVRIVDLARDMIRLSGLAKDAVEITFTGIRPGEKLYEELYFEDEETLPTAHRKLRAAYHRPYALENIRYEVAELANVADRPEVCICSKLRRFVPEFVPCCGDCDKCPEYHESHAKTPRRKAIPVAER